MMNIYKAFFWSQIFIVERLKNEFYLSLNLEVSYVRLTFSLECSTHF